jgi:hypothetical protein
LYQVDSIFQKKSKLNYWSPPNSTIKNSWCFCVAERYTLIYTIRSGDNWKLFSPNSGPPYPSRRHPSHVLEVDRVEGLWSTKKLQFRERFRQKQIVLVTQPLFTHSPILASGPLYLLSKITWGTQKSPRIRIPPGVQRLTGEEAQLATYATPGPPFFLFYLFFIS